EDVVEYAFVADFNLLQDAQQDISQHPWATPTGQQMMDTYFKIHQAHKEILCLNIKICHVATYLCDKQLYLAKCKRQLQLMHPALAHQVGLHHNIYVRFTAYHICHLHEISALPGF
ncbi:hypothetical protein BDR05DRAFT_863768, partial [Suillus weaverae]